MPTDTRFITTRPYCDPIGWTKTVVQPIGSEYGDPIGWTWTKTVDGEVLFR